VTQSNIQNLREALEHSPGNTPLRLMLADALFEANEFLDAEKEYSQALQNAGGNRAKMGLAQCFYQLKKYSACAIILEELLADDQKNVATLLLYAKTQLKERDVHRAIEYYQKALAIDPSISDTELDQSLRATSIQQEEPDDDELDIRFLEKPDINFSDVGGMEHVKKEIDLKIIKPMQHPELYKAYGKKVGGGILLYGPPGCGKTYLAKATAGQINAKFISIGLNDILDMWIGQSEKNLHDMFEMARKNAPCVLFIDEIDALGASRSDMKHSAGRQVINQFLQELDGIDTKNDGVLILGATNTPWSLDTAFRRPGRFDRIIFVPPPDSASRQAILDIKLAKKPCGQIDTEKLAKKMDNYSGADIDAIIDLAIEEKLEAAFVDGIPKPLETKDLLSSLKKHKASTLEWFKTAKNFALFANQGGVYDDILNYMKKNL